MKGGQSITGAGNVISEEDNFSDDHNFENHHTDVKHFLETLKEPEDKQNATLQTGTFVPRINIK